MTIDSIKIFPSIGIARLGNSTSDFYIGPELPGDRTPPPSGYKDSQRRIKRQAARFRLFGYESGILKKEITFADADIQWTVKLANTKADWKKFYQDGVGGGVEHPNNEIRNVDVSDRASLKITPKPCNITEPNQIEKFDTGKFLGKSVPLGEIRADKEGHHLLILGGFGDSDFRGSNPDNKKIRFADNDGWYDDISDGPVTASVRLNGTSNWIQASPAWVICAPPKFAPQLDNIITLYDALLQVAVDKLHHMVPAVPSFAKDIYPILIRAITMRWVYSMANLMHLTLGSVIPPPGLPDTRKKIFEKLRDPSLGSHDPSPYQDMPLLWSDVYDKTNQINLSLTKIQYNYLKQWQDGNFINDWIGPPVPETTITPEGLTRAALETCVGGALYPGIETSFMTRDTYLFIEPFRLDAALLEPGDLTKQMAVPWQADFYDCSFEQGLLWWPAHRPVDVLTNNDGHRVSWTRDIVNSHEDMIKNWFKLGFVVRQGAKYVETERYT